MEETVDEDMPEKCYHKPSFVLIAIDTHPSMFVKGEGSTAPPFKQCLDACYKLANSLIFTQNKRKWSPFAIVFANEDASASFVDFGDGILTTIKKLKETLGHDLCAKYERKGKLDLSAFFLFCKKQFKGIKSVFDKKTMIYVTNDDDPTVGVDLQRFAAINEIKEFDSNDITFELLTMNNEFDYKKFYNELFSVLNKPQLENIIEDEEGLYEKLSSLIVNRVFKRKLFFFPFMDDPKRFIKVIQKSQIKKEKLYNNAFVSMETGDKIKKKFQKDADAIAIYQLKSLITPLQFTPEERLQTLDSDLPVGYTLISFSARTTEIGMTLKDILTLEANPTEELPFFNQFWQYCTDTDQVLICIRKLRQPDKLRFVEFIPKVINDQKVFIIQVLPFINEFRYPPSKRQYENISGSEKQRNVVKQIVEALTFKYVPTMFTNPSMAKKKAYVKSKLLDCPKEDVEDTTLNHSGIDLCLDGLEDVFTKLYDFGDDVGTSKKRKPAAATSRSTKRKK